MTRDQLLKLHQHATVARNAAHRAYEIALKNRKSDGDCDSAYETLLRCNSVRNDIYRAILDLAVSPAFSPVVQDA